ncbi:hypothetical protein SERLA73DRAFT_185329 [Serpula lacrymans var. lacrymans S7.3]|uniref:WLM domain-containing protein n=2 Tax=Serpula lacrymans var. lacrymans TaxID=341189 RepID=F8Q4I1_SERL3|nr:uncharacterized protein SERLADRAFT_473717 [Serpula lacrymans var. lacrymans S7.9]EGN97036.1 hypothetical protein SERLA73DRAFT_185329 [Serpula lacrymans var. lacrymans S7.3]EGO22622.1 hypothetical protein SERLADRAFT_473717 [Serpula lacrymans var. lacrymans S7.9]
MTSDISIRVTFRGTSHTLSLSPESSLSSLQDHLEQLTSVPPSLQKLLYKGKKVQHQENASLAEVGLRDGIKVQMLGSTLDEIGGLKALEDEHHRKDRILRERALKPQVKVRSTGFSSSISTKYIFHRLEPLPHLPKPETALSLLTRLSNDQGIRHVMHKHEFSVGLLTELAPHEHPGLLGLNVNGGQEIKLRLRTNDYDGFRDYRTIRRVLCHELTHNVWSDHDDNFKELNSKLNREVVEFETSVAEGTYSLLGDGDLYEPSSRLEAEARAYVLGGDTQALSGSHMHDGVEERRRRILRAATSRLQSRAVEQPDLINSHNSLCAIDPPL